VPILSLGANGLRKTKTNAPEKAECHETKLLRELINREHILIREQKPMRLKKQNAMRPNS
jgi:hypothetical protein